MLGRKILAAIISNLILCIIIVSLSPSEIESRNPKPSLCNTFGGCGLGRAMKHPNGISEGKTEKARQTITIRDDDDDDIHAFLDDEGDDTIVPSPSPSPKLPVCTRRKQEPKIPCSLER